MENVYSMPSKSLVAAYAKYINETAKGKATSNPLSGLKVYNRISNYAYDDSWNLSGKVVSK